MRWHLAAAVSSVTLLAANGAYAQQQQPTRTPVATSGSIWHQPGAHRHALEIEIYGIADMTQWAWAWSGPAFGGGLRVGIPLDNNGPLSGVNNDLRINFGAQVFLWPDPNVFTWWITSPLVLQWNFFLSDRWSVFVEAGAAFDFFPMQGANCYDHPQYSCDTFLIHPDGGLGARLHFGRAGFPTLTMRLAYPTGLDVGVSF